LEYQAYESMALQVFQNISDRCHAKFPDITQVVIHHRLGKLKIGEISVLVAVGSPHRAEAFDACRYAIDTLKIDAPIWKKEFWVDGVSSWVNCD
jgi:molybdopterin synthase catalytic subunit